MSSTDNYTISVHHGSNHISMAHNNREVSIVSKESHIELGGDFESFVHIPVNQAYKAIFDEARLKYNAKQTRSDREIQDYLQKIKQDKKKNVMYEAIFSVGNKDNFPPANECYQILKTFYEKFKQQNPNFVVIGAYYHADEFYMDEETNEKIYGVPHLHLVYIPVSRNNKRGMKIQNSLTKALKDQGYTVQLKKAKTETQEEIPYQTAQMQWQSDQRQLLMQICQEHGFSIVEPSKSTRKHLDKELYVAQKKIIEASQKAMQEEERTYVLKEDNKRLFDENKKLYNENKIISEEASRKIDVLKKEKEEIQAIKETFENMGPLEKRGFENAKKYTLEKELLKTRQELGSANKRLRERYREIQKKDKEIERLDGIVKRQNVHRDKALDEQSSRIEELEDKLDRILDFVQTVHDVLKTTAFSIFKKFESKFNEFLSPTKEHRTEKTRDRQDLFIR